MKRLIALVSCALSACGGDPAPAPGDAGADLGRDVAPADAPPACVVGLWNPDLGSIDMWPDRRLITTDPSSATGVTLRVDPRRFSTTLDASGGFASILTDIDGLDGFAVNGQAFFRFSAPFARAMLPTADPAGAPGSSVGFVILSPGEPRLEGALLTTTDDDATLMLAPLHPLPAGATVAAYVTRRLTAAAGGCLEPAPLLARELGSAASGSAIAALRSLGVIAGVSELVALTTFPTQTTTTESRAVARDVAGRDFRVSARRACTSDPMGRFRLCELELVAGNYLDARSHLAPIALGAEVDPASSYTLKVSVWLPMGRGMVPYRTIVFGHGLGGSRAQAARLAGFAAPQGFATVAIDAVKHGDHPLNLSPGSPTLLTVLGFFALNPSGAQVLDARALRDHFRQSTYDKLQLVRLLQSGVDADGDGATDLDAARLAYLGVSLGGIMGPETLALTDAFGAAVLVVPGGRVSGIISDSATFAPIITAFRPPGTTRGDVARAFPLLQTVLDRGDAASFAPHVLRDRLTVGGAAMTPSVLVGVVLDDDTVPNVCNYTLARALGVPILAPLLRAVPGLTEVVTGPISGNFGGGRATGAMLQFDVVGNSSGANELATHSNVGASDVGAEAWLHFLRAHWDRGIAEAADPYASLGRMHGLR